MLRNKTILAIGYYHKGQTIMNMNIKRTNTQYREIPVFNLPDCAFRERLEMWVDDLAHTTVIVVAQENEYGEWISYIGYPALEQIKSNLQNVGYVKDMCEIRTWEQVLKLGETLSRRDAIAIFPEWRNKRYKNEI
jgi:hypothetical protein